MAVKTKHRDFKAALADEMLEKDPEVVEIEQAIRPPPPAASEAPAQVWPNNFLIAQQLVDFVHATWPQARMQDWTRFENAFILARPLLRRTWTQRKRLNPGG